MLQPFHFWCQKILPLVYDNSISYYEVLCKLADYINNIIGDQNKMNELLVEYGVEIESLKEAYSALVDDFNRIKNGEYIDEYIEALSAWIDKNLQDLILRAVKFVIFGLSNDGYFVAYTPEKWDFLKFDTPIDMSDPLYGHLIMRY